MSSPSLPDPVRPIAEPTPRPEPAYTPPSRTYDATKGWFQRMPNGGTVYQRPSAIHVDFFRRAPNGGGTTYHVSGGENGDK